MFRRQLGIGKKIYCTHCVPVIDCFETSEEGEEREQNTTSAIWTKRHTHTPRVRSFLVRRMLIPHCRARCRLNAARSGANALLKTTQELIYDTTDENEEI
jgi:hypothetical protein